MAESCTVATQMRARRVLWAVLALFGLAGRAEAAPDTLAVVDGIVVQGPDGAWRAVQQSAEAVAIGAAGERPLKVGDRLIAGQVVRTGAVQVRLRAKGDEQFVIGEGAEVELGERTWLQRIGDVFYRVHGVFRVRFGSVEAAVEGTRFVVDAGSLGRPGRVDVLAGVVRVAGESTAVRVGAGEAAVVRDGIVTEGTLEKVRLLRRLGQSARSVGVHFGGGAFGPTGVGDARLDLRLSPIPALEVWVEAGMTFDDERFNLPIAAGLAWRAGVVRLGAGPMIRIGARSDCVCPDETVVRPGLQGIAGVSVPLGGRLSVNATLRGAYAAQPSVDGAVGLSVGW